VKLALEIRRPQIGRSVVGNKTEGRAVRAGQIRGERREGSMEHRWSITTKGAGEGVLDASSVKT
jgi:hypothetical protein